MRKIRIAALLIAIAVTAWSASAEILKINDSLSFNGRKMEIFCHESNPEWGYRKPQTDTMIVLHPQTPPKERKLLVVLHSAGHNVYTALLCTDRKGNHDNYHAPADFYALYLDCSANRNVDWWWGGYHSGDQGLIARNSGPETRPAEKRVIDSVLWAIEKYRIDPNQVYLTGISMGGSGSLGIGLPHGDIFAAIKVDVPAGIEHVSDRMYLRDSELPAGVNFPDPPVVIDYSAQNDKWSKGHERFIRAMQERKYPLIFCWGAFGHAHNHANMRKVNGLIDAFDWLKIKKNESYPVFTNASTDDTLPWPANLGEKSPGQVNGFFTWKNLVDTPENFQMELSLLDKNRVKTAPRVPEKSVADVTLRRLQQFRTAPGQTVKWKFGSQSGTAKADRNGLLTIEKLEIGEPKILELQK